MSAVNYYINLQRFAIEKASKYIESIFLDGSNFPHNSDVLVGYRCINKLWQPVSGWSKEHNSKYFYSLCHGAMPHNSFPRNFEVYFILSEL